MIKCNDGYRFKVVTWQFSNYKHNMHTDNHNYHSAFQNYKVQQLLEKIEINSTHIFVGCFHTWWMHIWSLNKMIVVDDNARWRYTELWIV